MLHLERAAAGVDPIANLLAAWAEVPAAEIADAIEACRDPALAEVTTSNAIDGLARLSRVHRARDPRVASALVAWLADPPWHATKSKEFYVQIFERLVAIADPRSIETLAAAKKRVARVVKGATMRGWLVDHIGRTRDALEAKFPDGVPTLDAAARALVKTAKAHAAKATNIVVASRRTNIAAELLAAIQANPADHAARQVYADVLAEQQDPRGEFITMQLARADREPTKEQRAAEIKVLSRHVERWIEELATVTRVRTTTLDVGPARSSKRIRFERGFLAGLKIHGSLPKIRALVGHAGFATIEDLEIFPNPSTTKTDRDRHEAYVELLCATKFPALRSLSIGIELVPAALRAECVRDLAELVVIGPVSPNFASIAEAPALAALAHLQLRFRFAQQFDETSQRAVAAALAMPKLARLDVVFGQSHVHYVRDGRWTATLVGDHTQNTVALLALAR